MNQYQNGQPMLHHILNTDAMRLAPLGAEDIFDSATDWVPGLVNKSNADNCQEKLAVTCPPRNGTNPEEARGSGDPILFFPSLINAAQLLFLFFSFLFSSQHLFLIITAFCCTTTSRSFSGAQTDQAAIFASGTFVISRCTVR